MSGNLALLALAVEDLPAVNASLNATATALLIAGYMLIRRGRERAHKVAMIAALAVSAIFLMCYLIYHGKVGHVTFEGPPMARMIYLAVLITHIPLAALVPVLGITLVVLGVRDRRAAHRRLARWTLPIWLYVSVTGVVIYLMRYQLFPPDG